MTHNQIAYWQLQETKQHNAESRAETARSNRANEKLKHNANVETQRHNTVVESIDQYSAKEKARANRANESETHRSNVAHESETNRHNLAQEGYADREVSVKEALLPSEIAKNYGSAAGYGSKLITGLSGLFGSGGALYPLLSGARRKKNNNNSDSDSKGGGSSTQRRPVTVSTTPSKVRVIMNPQNEKLGDFVHRRLQEDIAKDKQRAGYGGFGDIGDRGTNSKSIPILDTALNAALVTGTRIALGPYIGPAASAVAALAPTAAKKLANLITP